MIEKYLDQIEEMTHVLSESSREDIRKDVIEEEAIPLVCSVGEPVITPIENDQLVGSSERSIRPLIKEKDTEIRQEAIRRSALLIERKHRKPDHITCMCYKSIWFCRVPYRCVTTFFYTMLVKPLLVIV